MSSHFKEYLHNGLVQKIKIKKVIVDINSTYQHIQIFDTYTFGKILVLDGIVQLTEKDEYAYSEMLAHTAIFSLNYPKNILIIGGGDGAVAEEILKHKYISSVDLVDIDKKVIELSKKHFKKINNNSLTNKKVNIFDKDAYDFISSCKKKYDIIIADRPDPIGAAKVLFVNSFYKKISKILKEDGVAVFQSGVPFFQNKETKKNLKHIKNIFNYYGIIKTVVPSYIGGFMAIVWASNKTNINSNFNNVEKRIKKYKITTNYYNTEIHRSAFILPNFLKKLIL